jgi:hypothetical protein
VSKNADISELLKKKAARRRRLSKLSFEEKIEIVRRLQKLSRDIKRGGARPTRKTKAHG